MKNILIVAIILLIINTLSPLQARNLSLEEAIDLVLTQSDDIKAMQVSILKTEQLVKEIKSSRYFSINANLNYNKTFIKADSVAYGIDSSNNLIAKGYNTDSNGYSGSAGIEIAQPIFTFGKISQNIKSAKEILNMSHFEKKILERQLKYTIKNLYYSTLYYEEILNIARLSYNNALNSKKLVQGSNIGRASRSDLIKIDSDIATRKPDINRYEYIVKEMKRSIKILSNINEAEDIILTSNFKPIADNNYDKEAHKESLKDHPEAEILRAQIKSYKHSANAKLANLLPSLSAYAGYERTLNSQNNTLKDSNNNNNTYIGLSLSVPIWDSGKARAASYQDKLEARKTEINLENTLKNLQTALENAFEKYEYYINIYINEKEAVDLAERSYENSLSRFQAGQTSATELNDTERSLTQNRQALQSTILELHNLEAQIEQLTQSIE